MSQSMVIVSYFSLSIIRIRTFMVLLLKIGYRHRSHILDLFHFDSKVYRHNNRMRDFGA